MKHPQLLMVGPDFRAKGGIASVAEAYRQSGIFERWGIEYVATSAAGTRFQKLGLGARSWLTVATRALYPAPVWLHLHAATHVSFWRKAALAMTAMAARRPYIFHLHGGGIDEMYERSTPAERWAMRLILRRAARVVVLSPQWMDWLARVCPDARGCVLPNPVHVGEPARDGREPATLLFLGRLDRRHNKGVFDLLEALVLVRRSHPDARLIIGGEGEDLARVQSAVGHLGLTQAVQFAGWVTGVEKDALMRRATLLVLASYQEGLPLVLLEALATEMPVIGTRVGGIPYAVRDGVDGVLVPVGSPPALAEAIGRLLRDPAARARMGAEGRQRVLEVFSIPAVGAAVDRLYLSLGLRPLSETQAKSAGEAAWPRYRPPPAGLAAEPSPGTHRNSAAAPSRSGRRDR